MKKFNGKKIKRTLKRGAKAVGRHIWRNKGTYARLAVAAAGAYTGSKVPSMVYSGAQRAYQARNFYHDMHSREQRGNHINRMARAYINRRRFIN